ncbi:MAG: D-alanyl-D-alanine carboxypeptidase, partial [Hyphomicrobiales bacterium]|nr:D-alanyl-D-alanine carboxypeptidase [Hyphomicrobiales bacterium]
TQLKVSAKASDQAPTRIGLDEGELLRVEDAIKALVTRSANDAAVVIAEAIGGDEETFARMMTRKARALGMTRTIYVNASGLPDADQITTARDQALLGRAIQDRFPQYYRYFSTRSFTYQGQFMGNHNRLLGYVDGVDGIKTGYTRASGFNLVTSVRRGNRYLVAVVLGGASAGLRDAKMRQLVERHIGEVATVRTAAKIVEAPETRIASVEPKAQMQMQMQTQVQQRQQQPDPPVVAAQVPAATQPIQPTRVKTISVKAGTVTSSVLVPFTAAPQATVAPAEFAVVEPRNEALPPPSRPSILGTLVTSAYAAEAPQATYDVASERSTPVAPPPAIARGAWIIQVGAFPEEEKAKERIREAQTLGKSVLANANPFTEKVVKGRQELYRARFAGFVDQDRAEAACRLFKRNDIACMAMKN